MQETWALSLGREDPLEKEMATHSSVLAWESHGQRSLVGYSPWGHKESDTTERLHTKMPIFTAIVYISLSLFQAIMVIIKLCFLEDLMAVFLCHLLIIYVYYTPQGSGQCCSFRALTENRMTIK